LRLTKFMALYSQNSFIEVSDMFVSEMTELHHVITQSVRYNKLIHILENLTISLDELLFRYQHSTFNIFNAMDSTKIVIVVSQVNKLMKRRFLDYRFINYQFSYFWCVVLSLDNRSSGNHDRSVIKCHETVTVVLSYFSSSLYCNYHMMNWLTWHGFHYCVKHNPKCLHWHKIRKYSGIFWRRAYKNLNNTLN
jgi:hypothetical protein